MMRSGVIPLFIFSLCLFFSSCSDPAREAELDKKELQLKELQERFARKEEEYQQLIRMRDSLQASRKDTLLITSWPEAIAGQWLCKMICTASDCNSYVVGDQRTDTWEFTTDSTGIVTRVINNNRLLRTFNARYDSAGIQLDFVTDTEASKKVSIHVALQEAGPGVLKGTQSTVIDQNCTATFSVDLTRSSNP